MWCIIKILESKGWMNEIGPYSWFQWYYRYGLGRRTKDEERQSKRWKGILSRFKGILFKMIKESGSKFNGYSISPKVRQILLHWGYELVESDVN